MKNLLIAITFLTVISIKAQENTEIFVFDIANSENALELSNMKNISNDEGYDNQPFFQDNNSVVFAGNNNGSTDIATVSLSDYKKEFYYQKTNGGEFSPQSIPDSRLIAAVRLDTSGLQRLYSYNSQTKNSEALRKDIPVAYFSFYDASHLLASVLAEEKLDLIFFNLKNNTHQPIVKNSGRSLSKIPKKEAMSYTASNEDGYLDIFQLDVKDLQSYFICELPLGIQDYAWLNDSQLIVGSNTSILMYDLFGDGEWEKVGDVGEFKIKSITRLAVSPNGKKIALVAEPQ